MLIDWFTVSAQIANFLILVWLLKRFLYKPVLAAIAAREKLIADQLLAAAAKKTEAQKERDDFQRKNEAFELQRAALLKQATDEVATERQQLLGVARKDSEALRIKLQESIQNERAGLNREITSRTQQEVFSIIRKILIELSTVSLEERLSEVFTRRLHGLEGQSKEVFAVALKTSLEPVAVCSTFDLPPSERAAIQNAINEVFSTDIRVRFETVSDLICGIELVANGQKIAWNIAEYLTALESSLGKIIDAKIKPV